MAFPVIKKWLADKNPTIQRAFIDELRSWTNRSYLKDDPADAIKLIAVIYLLKAFSCAHLQIITHWHPKKIKRFGRFGSKNYLRPPIINCEPGLLKWGSTPDAKIIVHTIIVWCES